MPGRAQGEFVMFCRERNPHKELWDGRRWGTEGAVAEFAADDAFPISDIEEILPGLLERSDRVYYSMGVSGEFDQRLLAWMQALHARRQRGHAPNELIDLDHILHEMRLFKSRRELGAMKRAARIAVAAHRRAMKICRPGMHEYELEAEFLHEFARHGATCSYEPIVASGENACILHYRSNRDVLKDGDLVLIDAGCEYELYASDVTRTFPVNGIFSPAQRELYDVVHAANEAAKRKARPGNHWNDPHDAAVRELTLGLRALGVLSGRLPRLLKEGAYRPYYMHKTGHWLGMDVHDVGDYKLADEWRMLEPGMVTTIEPGLYIAPDAKGAARRWRGIGIRLEDDVHVGRSGPEVLTADLPLAANEIEALMGAPS
jgi:Xaa-Pro aminopeptidase